MLAPHAAEPSLTVETPERVELSLDVAGLGTRALAYLVDALALFLFWVTAAFVFSLFKQGVSLEDFQALDSIVQAAIVIGAFLVQWGYWTLFETIWEGRSLGKRALRIRVVKVDGSPVGFADVALRNLGRVADFLPALYALGLVTMVANPRSRRLGDLLAGTLVVRERKVDLSRYEQAGAGPGGRSATLAPAEYELVTSFLERAEQLEPEARERVALRVAEPFVERLGGEKKAEHLRDGAAAERFLRALVDGNG